MTSVTLSQTSAPVLSDEQQYRLMYAATFLFFLAATLVRRAGRRVTGTRAPAGTPRSLFAEARAAGSSALLFAFLG